MKHKKRSATHPLFPLASEYCTIGGKKKRKYKTQLDAELFGSVRGLSQYKCEHCGFWHNTASKPRFTQK